MENGWKMRDVDDMDLLGYLRLRAWKAQKKKEKKEKTGGGQKYIDQLWPGVGLI